MRLAVAHEWLTNWAGSERVAEQLVRTARPAELVASVVDPDLAREYFGDLPVRSLWPGRLPAATTHWARYAPAMLAAWAGTRVEADALLVSAHFAAHAATVRFAGPSIVYYHTPARILWRTDLELGRLPACLRATAAATVLPPLRRYDRWIGQHPTVALASSTAVAQRIALAYGRPARVINPPVAVERWTDVVRDREPSRLVWLGRLVPYKRPDLAIEAARRAGLPLTVIGDGPERARLEASAPEGVEFLGHAPEHVVREVLADARALIFPGEEDFGIAPVEALAAGVPVVAPALGGAPDYLRHGENAIMTRGQDPDELAAALRTAWDTRWDHTAIRAGAQRFAPERFRSELAEVLDATLGPAWRPAPASAPDEPDPGAHRVTAGPAIAITDVDLGPDVEASVLGVLRSGRLTQGPVVAELESAFAALCGTPHAIAVHTGTAALIAALEAAGIGPGDEVIVPAFTFVATANAVLATGADVRLADIRADDFALDPDALAAAIGPRTRAVVAVHLFGRPADLPAIEPLARRHGLYLVEDAAQAHGARVGDRTVGSVGTGCFSFYATKNLAAGEGGMVTTGDDALADRLWVLRNQGMRARYAYETVGHNWRMTDLAAAVVLPQLRRYDAQVARRRAHAARLTALLEGVPGLRLPASSPDRASVWHQYTVLADDRDALATALAARGIATGVYYPRVLQDHDCYRTHPRVHPEETPVARDVARRCLSLPVHAGLDDDAVERIAAAVREALA